MDDLVQWLRAVLNAEAEEAQATADEFGAVWMFDEAMDSVRSDTGADVVAEPETPREFIARHDPARVLREIDSKRAIVDQYAEVAANDINEVEYAHGWANALGMAVRLLATVYRDRPGYREEWRP